MLRKSLLLLSTVALLGCETLPNTSSTTYLNSYDASDVISMSSAPLSKAEPLTRIAFGSCLSEKEDQTIWNTIRADKPDAFLFIGDNVYGDVYSNHPSYTDPSLPMLRESYNVLAGHSEFTQFRQEVPLLVTWDDHDYGKNDAGADFMFREQAEAIFLKAWDIPTDDARRNREGIYSSEMIGPEGQQIQIILLDTRYFRTYLQATDERNAPGKERYVPLEGGHGTMLGEEQWKWLEAELKKPADLRLIASSIQVHADGHGWEAWKMMPAERDRFYNLIDATGVDNAILLSGDRHAGGIYYRDDVTETPLYEMTASSLNLPASRWRAERGETRVEDGPNRIGTMQFEVNYGLLDIDWENREVNMTLRSPTGGDFKQAVPF